MKIENEIKLDFKDVLIRPQRSSLVSRSEVSIERTFTFKHSPQTWTGIPIVAANMDTVGTLNMHNALHQHTMLTALHKHYSVEELIAHFRTPGASQYSFYSMGIGAADYDKFQHVFNMLSEVKKAPSTNPIQMVCVDVANGYTDAFSTFIRRLRTDYPHLVIMAGNVVTYEMTQELINAGADIVKIGIGPGSVCTTRKMTGVGYPQLSAIIECADAAHGLKALVCSDGGCTVPGDIAKAFGANADFVMLGGMLAGHDQSGGELDSRWIKTNEVIVADGNEHGCLSVEQKYKRFYGMSSDTAMNKHNGGVAKYRASEGKTVEVPYRGDVQATIQDVLGGLRSACTYVGADTLKHLSKRTTFIRVTQQLNEVFGKS
jgi:GMP reductase